MCIINTMTPKTKFIVRLSVLLLLICAGILFYNDGLRFTLGSVIAVLIGWIISTLVLIWITGKMKPFKNEEKK